MLGRAVEASQHHTMTRLGRVGNEEVFRRAAPLGEADICGIIVCWELRRRHGAPRLGDSNIRENGITMESLAMRRSFGGMANLV